MNWWIKLGCFLTGWNKEILAQCSEASHSKIKKYTSALLILMILWGATGYCFAHRYMQFPIWACFIVSTVFITIVVQIERQIILVHGKNKFFLSFRICIAIVMAILGSTIVDQTIFGKDITKAISNRIELQVEELLPKRLHVIDDKLSNIKIELDSINLINKQNKAEFEARPFIIQTTVTSLPVEQTQKDGSKKMVSMNSIQKTEIVNPIQEEIKSNEKIISQLTANQEKWSNKKQSIEEDVRKECRENTGFLEELEVMLSIITTRPVAAIFYLILFVFLVSLELFVAMSKMLDDDCEYEQVLKAAQIVKTKQFDSVFKKVRAA